MSSHILTKREKIGYGLGDAASHIIFDNVMFYMMFFIRIFLAFPLASSALCSC